MAPLDHVRRVDLDDMEANVDLGDALESREPEAATG
jgi:hypothetical protein